MEHEHEEVEQIPWEMLADRLEGGRKRSLGMIVLGAVAALVAGVVAVNVMRRPSGTTVDLARDSTEVAAAPTPSTVPTATVAPATGALPVEPTPTAAPAPGLYSEADLMAVLPEDDVQLVAARAEWFVSDFFTVLGPDDPVDGLAEALPRPVAAAGGYSWVEWVRTMTVRPAGAGGEYEAAVLFRTMRRDEGGELVRTPVRAVAVPLRIDADGAIAVGGLPRPLPVPAAATAVSADLVVPPVDIAAAALAGTVGIGDDPEVVGALAGNGTWAVVVTVGDASGVRWPYEIVVPAVDSGPES